MFEGRRPREAGPQIGLSKGFLEFSELLRRLIRRGKLGGSFAEPVNEFAAASALEGAAEGMIRDRLIEIRFGRNAPYSERAIRTHFDSILTLIAVTAVQTTSR
jgi:hypothetical protein